MRRLSFVRISFSALCFASLAIAEVTRVDISSRTDVLNAKSFGNTGPYECVTGTVHFAVDPKLAANRIIADIDLAPLNEKERVAFSADLYVLRPKLPGRGNGIALIEVSNRGGKSLPMEFDFASGPVNPDSATSIGDGFLLDRGFTLVWVGWEFDVPPKPGALRAVLPVASNHGKPITGMVRAEWIGDRRESVIPMGDKGQIGYAALDPDSADNKLFVRDQVSDPRTLIPHTRWKFADPSHVKLEGDFAPGRIYEVVYAVKDPPVAGLGLAAIRDFVSYLKDPNSSAPFSQASSTVHRAIAFGVSQSGRFLREFLYDGFNSDEKNHQVFDGVWAHVAGAGRGSFNERFAQPSRDGHPFLNLQYPVDVPPFDDEGLLSHAHRDHVTPKVFLTNGSYEYWGRCASLIHTTLDGKYDDPPSAQTRIYSFAGSQHSVGSIPPRAAPAQNLTNPNDYRFGLRALLVSMENWITSGAEPPSSRYPMLSQGELTTARDLHFPAIHGVTVAQRPRQAYRLDFSQNPPAASTPFPTYVPQADSDGNELAGIRMPEIAVPLATYTGWNLRDPSIGSPQELLAFWGSWIPFAPTQQARKSAGDPRQSIAERYPSESDYLSRIDQSITDLVRERYLLEADRNLLRERADKEWQFRATVE